MGKGMLVATVVAAAVAVTAPAAQAQLPALLDTVGACTTTPYPGPDSYDRRCYAGVGAANVHCSDYYHFQGFLHYSQDTYESCGLSTPILALGYTCGSHTSAGGGFYTQYEGCDYGPVDTYCNTNPGKCWVTILAPGVIRITVAGPYVL